MTNSSQALPPGMAKQFADRAKRMDGCVYIGEGIYEFAQGNNVVCLMHANGPLPFGHVSKDPRRAAEIRDALIIKEVHHD